MANEKIKTYYSKVYRFLFVVNEQTSFIKALFLGFLFVSLLVFFSYLISVLILNNYYGRSLMVNGRWFSYDVLFVWFIWFLFFSASRRVWFSHLLILLLASVYTLGFIIKYGNLEITINLTDIITLPDVLKMFTSGDGENKSSQLGLVLGIVVFLLMVLFCVYVFIKTKAVDLKIWQRFALLLPIMITVIYVKAHLLSVNLYKGYLSPLRDKGIYSSFWLSFENPVDRYMTWYSDEEASRIREKYPYLGETGHIKEKKPNVVFYLMESFEDPSNYGVVYREDPIPNIRRIMKEHTSGRLYVSTYGTGTAITAGEMLTGMSFWASIFHVNTFTNLYKKPMKSMVTFYKDNGYYSEFLGVMDFYEYREKIPYLGFQNITNSNTIPSWRKYYDSMLVTDHLKGVLENNTAPVFFYCEEMTIHYPIEHFDENEINLDRTVDIVGNKPSNAEVDLFLRRYAYAAKHLDASVKKLTDYLSTLKEPTILVAFGDHHYPFPSNVENYLLSQNKSILKGYKKYTTPYFIWTNYPMKKEDIDMSSNRLVLKVFDELNVDHYPYYFQMIDDITKDYDVYNGYYKKKHNAKEVENNLQTMNNLENNVREYLFMEYDFTRGEEKLSK